VDAYRAAIALEEAAPGSGGRAQASTHGGLADALLQLDDGGGSGGGDGARAAEAASSARAAIALQPSYANAHATLGKALLALTVADAAATGVERSLRPAVESLFRATSIARRPAKHLRNT